MGFDGTYCIPTKLSCGYDEKESGVDYNFCGTLPRRVAVPRYPRLLCLRIGAFHRAGPVLLY